MVQGRKPDMERCGLVTCFRSQGLSLREIGRRLGISGQAVFLIVRSAQKAVRRSAPCCVCGGQIVSVGVLPPDAQGTFCVACLEKCPQATFGQRLKAFRLAAGLTRIELARAARVYPNSVQHYEEDRFLPRPDRREALAGALGMTVERLGTGGPVLGRRPPGRPRKEN